VSPALARLGGMPVVRLRPPLRERAGGEREVDVAGATVGEALRQLERTHPALAGWVLDDQGHVREHVAVFLDGERVTGDVALAGSDHLEIIGAVSGGADALGEVRVVVESAGRSFASQAVSTDITEASAEAYLRACAHAKTATEPEQELAGV